jgi:putative DNA primase/helicase
VQNVRHDLRDVAYMCPQNRRMPNVNAAEVATRLGQAYRSSSWWRCRCPVHGSAGATLALKDGDRGLLVVCHAGCRRADVLAELQRSGLLDDVGIVDWQPDPGKAWERRDREAADRRRRITGAMDIWGRSYPAHDETTLPRRYLSSRLITVAIPKTIRAHGMMRHKESGEQRPAMIGLVEHVEQGAVGIHITFLAIDGSQKATVVPVRKTLGPIKGGAVRLGPIRPDDWLIVGEGIETVMSVMQATDLPGWAALSAPGIVNLILPSDVTMVLIAADNDKNDAGWDAALRARRRWLAEGRLVKIRMPPIPGTDWNDVLTGVAPARIGGSRNAV